jgi:phage-related tail protein
MGLAIARPTKHNLETVTIMTFEELEQIVTGLAVSQARLTDLVQSQQGSIEVLQQATSQLQQSTERLVSAQVATFDRFDAMQSEIRGLQTENRRILERLESWNNPDED